MDRESQEPRAHSPTWPPGMPVGAARSLEIDGGACWKNDLRGRVQDAARCVRRYGRDGSTALALAVCAFSFGFSLTDRFCDFDSRAALTWTGGRAEQSRATATQRASDRARVAARTEAAAPRAAQSVAFEEYPPLIVGPQASQPWASAALTRVSAKRATGAAYAARAVQRVKVPEAPAVAVVDELSGLDRLSLLPDSGDVDAHAPPRAAGARGDAKLPSHRDSLRNEVWPTDGSWRREGARRKDTEPPDVAAPQTARLSSDGRQRLPAEASAKADGPPHVSDEASTKAGGPARASNEASAKAGGPARLSDEASAKADGPARLPDEASAKADGGPPHVSDEASATADGPLRLSGEALAKADGRLGPSARRGTGVRATGGEALQPTAAIEALNVEGALPQGVVSRGVARLLPQYERCSELCDGETQRLTLSAIIDEAGHGRHVVVEGPSQAELRRCLEQATSHLSVPAPDTGTARVRWTVRFASK